MKAVYIFFAGVMICVYSFGQPFVYTTSNAHSHNDYKQTIPFYKAYYAGFGSIEADIFLSDDKLIVAHAAAEMNVVNTLQKLYLQPLDSFVQQHNGYPYADTSKSLQLLIDIKTDSIHTVQKLVDVLKQFPKLSNNNKISFVITGNRPDQSLFDTYPSFIFFDGDLNKTYSDKALPRIKMLSADMKNYTHWNGKDIPTTADKNSLETAINKAHALHKTVRFWDAPDFINAWIVLMKLEVDYINTDHIYSLASFLNNLSKTTTH